MQRSDRYLKTTLTPEQSAAAMPHVGRKAVVATAGAGKSTTLAVSIAMKLYGDHGPTERDEDIAAMTFARTAAGDLRRKISLMAGRSTRVGVGTIHSFCLNLIERHPALAGFTVGVQMVKDSERRARMQSVLHGHLVTLGVAPDKYPLADFILAAGLADVLSVSQAREDLGRLVAWRCPRPLLDAYETYKNYQKVGGFVDFDTMLVFACELLKKLPDRDAAAAAGVHIPRHIYVDEAQDSSAVQWAIVTELARLAVSITVIGDDDQSIYGWRGATPWRFKKFYEEADVQCLLTSNRRCPANIVAVGEGIVAKIPAERRITKILKSSNPVQRGNVMVCAGADRAAVVAEVLHQIHVAVQSKRVRYRDFFILYRNTTHVVDEYTEAMIHAEIPYRVLGGRDPMDSDEMHILRYALTIAGGGPWDQTVETPGSWLGLMEAAGVSAEAASGILNKARDAGGRAGHYVTAIAASRVAADSKRTLLDIADAVMRARLLKRRVTVSDVMASDAVARGIQRSIVRASDQFVKSLRRSGTIDPAECEAARLQYVEQRVLATTRFIEAADRVPALELARKLSGVSHEEDGATDEGQDVVTLATAHSSKGLEASVVFIIDPLDDVWPSRSAGKGLKVPKGQTEALGLILSQVEDEERRLLYVAVTRARQNLIFVCPRERHGRATGPRTASALLGDDTQRAINEVLDELPGQGAIFKKIF
jgi:DNA helicase-2/ATP-dependent DNA helicase PcrA